MANKLKYEVTTNPSPLYYTRDSLNPSITNILIAITPKEKEDVLCNGLQFAIQLGSDDRGLTTVNNESSIVPESLQASWVMERFSVGIYRAFPLTPGTVIKAGEVITFQLQGVIVNEVEGTSLLNIVANLPGGSEDNNITLFKVRSSLDIGNFSANPTEVYPGQSSNLSWTSTAASKVILLPDNPSDLPTTGTHPVSPIISTTYYLTVFGEGPSITKSFPLQVVRANIVEFTSSANSIKAGETVELRWVVQGAASIEITPGNYKNLPASGSITVQPTSITVYSLKASNVNSQDQRDLTIVVDNPIPRIVSFGADPLFILWFNPSPVQLFWSITDATLIDLTPGPHPELQPEGSLTVYPNQTTTYTLTASNVQHTVSQSITVTLGQQEATVYQQGAEGGRMIIGLYETNLPLGSAVSLFCPETGTNPKIDIPKTTITEDFRGYVAAMMSDIPANFVGTFYVTYYPEGKPLPTDATLEVRVIPYNPPFPPYNVLQNPSMAFPADGAANAANTSGIVFSKVMEIKKGGG